MGKNHTRIFSEISRLTSLSDINRKVGESLAKKYQVNYYSNYKEMLSKEKIDAISVAVPANIHREIAIECLRRKIPTLVEKPIAHSLKDAYQILKEVKRQNIFLMIGHIERFNPAVLALKRLIENKRLGKIMSLLAIRVGISPPKFSAADVTTELAIHDIDVFNFLLNEMPINKNIIKGKIFKNNASDSATILLQYNFATGSIQTNWITPIKMRRLYVTGTEGFAELNYISQRLILYDKVMSLKESEGFYEFITFLESPKKEVFIYKKEPLKEELSYFLQHRNDYSESNVDNAIKALEICVK